tara:strand:+ start:5 stop:1066 length:1062 start_codon:yes stop_codon:yes gene_type:complete
LKDWTEVKIKVSDSLEKTISVLNDGTLGVALVVDDNNKLLGTVTDGDIRRAILKHFDMSALVENFMNNNPITSLKTDSRQAVLAKMRTKDLLHMPITDKNNVLVGLETLQNLIDNKQYDNPVFLMAGGFGSRLHPLTEHTPKPLLKVGTQPILETIIGRFIKAGFHKFYISTFYKAFKIHEYFGDGSDWGISIEYVNEVKPLGTAGSIGLLPKNLPNLPILMMNGDVLTNMNFEHLLEFHEKQKGIATMCIREYNIQIPFGVVNFENHNAKSFLEKPVKKFFVNAGVYVFDSDLIDKVKEGEYIDMPNLLEQQMKEGGNVSVFPIHEYWKDIGHLEEYLSVNDSFNNGFSLDD